MSDTDGPVIVWVNNGCEGWAATSYATIGDALMDARYGSQFVITRLIDFEIVEKQRS